MPKGSKEALYEELLNTIPDIVYEIDEKGIFIFLSRSVSSLGYEPKELVGKYFGDIVHPDDIERVSRLAALPRFVGRKTGDDGSPKLFDERRTAGRMTKDLILRLIPKDRAKRPVYVNVSSAGKWEGDITSANKCLVGSIGIMRDITKEMELDKLKEEFVNIVCHELRAPLAVMKESSSLLLDGIAGELKEKQKKLLTANMSSIERLLRIVNDLLDIAKIEAGKDVLHKEEIKVEPFINDLAASFRGALEKKDLNFKVNIGSDCPPAYADRDKLAQVVVNLLSNALKFTKKGQIELGVFGEGSNIVFSVKDTGIGIPADKQKEIFSKFTELKHALDMGEKGTGLGLSIAKGIVEMHDGSISVESEPSKGAKFTFYIPGYSAEAVFKDKIRSAIREAGRANSKVSFASVELAGGGEAAQKAAEVIKKNLQREGDGCFAVGDRALAVLPGCREDGILKVCERLESALKTKFKLRHATYPVDAGDVNGILNIVIT